MPIYTKPPVIRDVHLDALASMVKRGDENECWEWTGTVNKRGYAWYSMTLMHRASYVLHVGPIDDGMLILHSCHNRRCVNPSHLRQGTAQDNSDDARKAGRIRNGWRSTHATRRDFVSLAEAARMCKVAHGSVTYWLRTGKVLRWFRDAGQVWVHADDLQQHNNSRVNTTTKTQE